MEKKYCILVILVFSILTITGCSTNKKARIDDPGTISKKDGVIETEEDNNFIIEQENIEEITPLVSESSKWSTDIIEKGEKLVDLNMDGQMDQIQLSYIEKEGSQYISEFSVKLEGNKGEFVINDYDASLMKIELFDFNQDNMNEIILMFDTRGGGGEGTRDIYVLWIETDKIKGVLLDPYIKNVEDKVLPYNSDGIYSLEKVEYKGQIRLLARQYMWGEDGHSDKIGDLLSIISTVDEKKEAFIAEVAWID